MRTCEVQDLGRLSWKEAYGRQRELVDLRKRGEIGDQLLFVEHPHVVTMGRNGKAANVLASPEILERAGIAFHETNRGGDVTYHGPGQIVGYPILDLNGWKRDVHAYVRAIESIIIETLQDFGIAGERSSLNSGVWINGASRGEGGDDAKICAVGIHISRWVTSHGFALNVSTDLNYFRYIVPCGLSAPVTSMREQGSAASREDVRDSIARRFGEFFGYQMNQPALAHSAVAQMPETRNLTTPARPGCVVR
jgi:lipoyl(octanoyl) transferase